VATRVAGIGIVLEEDLILRLVVPVHECLSLIFAVNMNVAPRSAMVEAGVQENSVIGMRLQQIVLEEFVQRATPLVDDRRVIRVQILGDLPGVVDRLEREDRSLDVQRGILSEEAFPSFGGIARDTILVDA